MNAEIVKQHTAGVFIMNDTKPSKTLLLHHKKLRKWMQPGGHQEAFENPLETAIREAKEETGIDISGFMAPAVPLDGHVTSLPVPAYVLEQYIDLPYLNEPAHYHTDLIYVVHLPEQIVSHNPEESHDIGWFTAEEVETLPTFENVRKLLLEELAK